MTLRARVLVGAALIAVVLAAGAAVTTRATRAHLTGQVDEQLAAVAGHHRDLGPLARGQRERLSDLYAAVVVDGALDVVARPNLAADLPAPDLDVAAVVEAAARRRHFTVDAEDGSLRYRVRAVGGPRGRYLVVALPLDGVDQAVRRLLVVELLTTAAVLAVVGLVAWWVVHLGVRPIKQMTGAAAAIAGGDLSSRVPDVGAVGTEAAELGTALNRMLGRIEDAFDERARSEERLRRFVADASHELRTPVTTVRGYAELYRAGGLADPSELDEAMRRTEQEAVRMAALIEDLLQLARFDQGRPLDVEPVDLAALADDAARDARAVAPDRAVTVEVPRPFVVAGDEHRLRQVVANVVGNALVHTEAGTPIEIRGALDGGVARLEVVDHGAGMAPEVAARAFERFYRADPARSRHRGGTGLGLAIVQAAVAAHGGTVSLASEPGQGTTVRIELPATAATATPG